MPIQRGACALHPEQAAAALTLLSAVTQSAEGAGGVVPQAHHSLQSSPPCFPPGALAPFC